MIEAAWKRRRWIGEIVAGDESRRSLICWLMLRGMISEDMITQKTLSSEDMFACTAGGLANLNYI